MRAFKKLMAGMIATAIAATFATSAFAAELNADNKMVLSEGESYTPATTGQTTVLVVPYDNWVSDAVTDLTDADILYIDQWEDAATAQVAITEGLGVKLNNGELDDINDTEGAADYYVLFGGNTNEGEFEIRAFGYVIDTVEDNTRVIQLGECDGLTAAVDVNDALAVLRHAAGTKLLTGDALIAAECDGLTAAIDVNDALAILRHAAGTKLLGKITVNN